MAGVSFTGSRLSAIAGTSSATTGAGLSGNGFAAPGLAAGLGTNLDGGDFAGAALPPLMARKTGLPLGVFLPDFLAAALPAVLTALLALAISLVPSCPRPEPETTMLCRLAI